METIKYGGEVVHFKEMTAEIGYKHCVLCNKQIKIGHKIYLVTSSSTPIMGGPLFPNVLVHKDCCQPIPPFDMNNPFVWTAGQLSKLWREAQQYKYWFSE